MMQPPAPPPPPQQPPPPPGPMQKRPEPEDTKLIRRIMIGLGMGAMGILQAVLWSLLILAILAVISIHVHEAANGWIYPTLAVAVFSLVAYACGGH